jgi:hypothetical protein
MARKNNKANGGQQPDGTNLNGQQPMSTSTNTDPDVKSLDLAWEKITKGRELWIEGTLELIQKLAEKRKLYDSDQAFGAWLNEAGYGEDRITRQDRAALLNMAEHLDLTREVLEQTHRWSWRLIWEKEIQQPRLPSGGQPPEAGAEAEDATLDEGEVAKETTPTPVATRRGKRNKRKRETPPEWSSNNRGWINKQIAVLNGVMDDLNKVMANCTPEQHHNLRSERENVDAAFLLNEAFNRGGYVSAKFHRWLLQPTWKAAQAELIRLTRVRTTPARRGREPVQPGA